MSRSTRHGHIQVVGLEERPHYYPNRKLAVRFEARGSNDNIRGEIEFTSSELEHIYKKFWEFERAIEEYVGSRLASEVWTEWGERDVKE